MNINDSIQLAGLRANVYSLTNNLLTYITITSYLITSLSLRKTTIIELTIISILIIITPLTIKQMKMNNDINSQIIHSYQESIEATERHNQLYIDKIL